MYTVTIYPKDQPKGEKPKCRAFKARWVGTDDAKHDGPLITIMIGLESGKTKEIEIDPTKEMVCINAFNWDDL